MPIFRVFAACFPTFAGGSSPCIPEEQRKSWYGSQRCLAWPACRKPVFHLFSTSNRQKVPAALPADLLAAAVVAADAGVDVAEDAEDVEADAWRSCWFRLASRVGGWHFFRPR